MTDPALPGGHPAPRPSCSPFQLGGKVAVVTGGASGIGESVARLLARQGAQVCVFDRDADGAERVVLEIRGSGGSASFTKCDVASAADVAQAFAALDRDRGRLDLLI